MSSHRSNGFTNVGETLRRHWSSHDVEINAGVPAEELDAFEARENVLVPPDFRDYFLCINGMPPDAVDETMIRFWMLEEVQSISEGASDYSKPDYIENPESFFLFADYSLWAHAYVIRLSREVSTSNEVAIIGHQSPIVVAGSFSEFVDTYLTDRDRLF